MITDSATKIKENIVMFAVSNPINLFATDTPNQKLEHDSVQQNLLLSFGVYLDLVGCKLGYHCGGVIFRK